MRNRLPLIRKLYKKWKALQFNLVYQGDRFSIKITQKRCYRRLLMRLIKVTMPLLWPGNQLFVPPENFHS